MKRTSDGKWAHVVCALYIPEVRFGNTSTKEPILIDQVPMYRFNKVYFTSPSAISLLSSINLSLTHITFPELLPVSKSRIQICI